MTALQDDRTGSDAVGAPERPFAAVEDLPLRGVKVLDLSRFIAGPYAATLLGDLGADVIKVEAVDRDDPAAHTAPVVGEDSLYYLSAVRNKRSVAVDLKSEQGYDLLRRLVADSDIVIENYRRDVPARIGLDYASLRGMNSRIVVCSVRSYSAESSLADSPAYDSAVQAYTGLMSVTGQAGGPVARMGIAVADLGSGMYAAIGILAALHRAAATGRGTHLGLALADSGISLMALQLTTYLNTGVTITRIGTEHPAMAPLKVFTTASTDVLVMAAKDEEFVRLCTAIDRTDLLAEDRFRSNDSRVRHQAALHAALQATLATRPAGEWVALLEKARIACTPVRDVADIAADDDFRRTMRMTADHPRLGALDLVRNPLTLDGGSPPLRSVAPRWGEDTDEVLTELGLTADEIVDLRSSGTVR